MVGDTATKRFRLVIDLLGVLTAVALIMSGYLFYARITMAHNTQTDAISAIRTVLCLAEQQVEDDPRVPVGQKIRAARFYRRALERIHALPCPPVLPGVS